MNAKICGDYLLFMMTVIATMLYNSRFFTAKKQNVHAVTAKGCAAIDSRDRLLKDHGPSYVFPSTGTCNRIWTYKAKVLYMALPNDSNEWEGKCWIMRH